YLRALAFHHRSPFSVRALCIHLESIRRGRKLLDNDPRFHFLATHHAFVVVCPGIALHGSAWDRRHRHDGVVNTVVRIGLLFSAVAQNVDSLAGPHWCHSLRMAYDRKLPFEPGAFAARGKLTARPHLARLHLSLGTPVAQEIFEALMLGTRV